MNCCKYFACKECKDEVNQNGYLNKHQYLKSQNCFRDGNPKKPKYLVENLKMLGFKTKKLAQIYQDLIISKCFELNDSFLNLENAK